MSSSSVGRPVSFPRALQNALFPEPLTPRRSTPRGLTLPLRSKRSLTEILEIGQTTERIESLTASMQREQIVLPQRLGLEFPDAVRPNGVVAGKRESKGTFSLVPGQASSSIEHVPQIVAFRQIVRLITGQFLGNPFQLLAIGQGMRCSSGSVGSIF